MSPPVLSIVILSWNTKSLTLSCLSALRRDSTTSTRETIVVDNASADGTCEAIESEFPEVRLIRNHANRLYAEGNNQGGRAAQGAYLCLLNSDTEVRPGALDKLVQYMQHHPEYGAVGPKLLNPDGTVQQACARIPGLLNAMLDSTFLGKFPPGSWLKNRTSMSNFDHLESRDVEQPPAACLVMRREDFLALGGLDPRLSLYFNDVDLCRRILRIRKKIRFLAEAEVVHHLGRSTDKLQQASVLWFSNREQYYRKWYGFAGRIFLRSVLHLWRFELQCRILLGPRTREQKRRALDELRAHVASVKHGATPTVPGEAVGA